MPSQDWQIKPRSTACGACGSAFADGQTYVSSLRLSGAEYERSDCCESCWRKGASEGVFSVWRGIFQAEKPAPEVLRKETAESLLRRLVEKNDPSHHNAIFILAVMLERRRILSEKEVRKSDGDSLVRVYEHRQTGETFIITDPLLNLEQLGHVQEQVAGLLSAQG